MARPGVVVGPADDDAPRGAGALGALTRFVAAEAHRCGAELDRLSFREGRRRPLGQGRALAASAALAVWGNAVVVLGRRLDAPEATTLVAHPVAAVVVLVGMKHAGWTLADLGLSGPALDRPRQVPLAVVAPAALAVVVLGAAGGLLGPGSGRLAVVRLLVATAFGEEALHRGAALALWAASGASGRRVVAADAAGFGLWHVAGALGGDGRSPVAVDAAVALALLEVAVPSAGALVLLWGRLRFRSLVAPWLLHAAANLPGSLLAT